MTFARQTESVPHAWELDIGQRLEALKTNDLAREFREVVRTELPMAIVDGRPCISFSTCDYLDLSRHADLVRAVQETVQLHGVGTGGSRYLAGTAPLHNELERKLARFHGKPEAVVFPTGYMANLGVLSSITTEQDVIFSDALNHASIIDGSRFSRSAVSVWRHNDPEHLESVLRSTPVKGRRLIVCESLYSMTGEFAPLKDICNLARRFGAVLVLDEAHAVGVYGDRGEGYAAASGLAEQIDILTGTQSKSVGTLGGYVATSHDAATLIRSTCRPFIFTASLPTCLVAASSVALELLMGAQHLRAQIAENAQYTARRLSEQGFYFFESRSHVLPILIGSTAATKEACRRLLDYGYYVQSAIFPSVEQHLGRLRTIVTPAHRREHIDGLVDGLVRVRDDMGGFD